MVSGYACSSALLYGLVRRGSSDHRGVVSAERWPRALRQEGDGVGALDLGQTPPFRAASLFAPEERGGVREAVQIRVSFRVEFFGGVLRCCQGLLSCSVTLLP